MNDRWVNAIGQAAYPLTGSVQDYDPLLEAIGDAAFIPRPHTAASLSKAAANAIVLADAPLEQNHNVPQALDAWEPEQLAFGPRLMRHGQALGKSSQFIDGTGY